MIGIKVEGMNEERGKNWYTKYGSDGSSLIFVEGKKRKCKDGVVKIGIKVEERNEERWRNWTTKYDSDSFSPFFSCLCSRGEEKM